MSAQSGPLTTFTVFPALPYELRCMVWEASCFPRVVEIEYEEETGFTPRCADPIALKVCKESRNTIIQSYPLCFGSIFHQAKTRFNFSIDTLYIDGDLDENVPHFFSTFGSLEISSLQVLAMEGIYTELTVPGDINLTTQLHSVITKLPALRELCFVYDISEMTGRTIGCTEGHTIELHEEIPKELDHPSIDIEELPKVPTEKEDDLLGFKLWAVKTKTVYGWRRCPHGIDFSDTDDIEDEDIPVTERHVFTWGRPPFSMARANMTPGDFEADGLYGDEHEYEDDLYGYGYDSNEDFPDVADEEDDEDDSASVDSLD
ncbi:hypothetical protein VTL71DRAFT_11986 [Oculimacula yallundae]|uniref:2EXR domain-containing protein n=1 Tax=Oculimacula yallundae TaxID=86028 RepID=A0ABR4CSB1_9HELO